MTTNNTISTRTLSTKEAASLGLPITRKLSNSEAKSLGLPVASKAKTLAVKSIPTYELDMDCFIVPNKLGTVSELTLAKPNSDLLQKVGKLNNASFSIEEELLELWFVSRSPEFVSDNAHDNGIRYLDQYISFPVWCLPKSLLRNQKEGDILTLTLPGYVNKRSEGLGTSVDCRLKVNLRFAQKCYRYKTFGSFEEVLAQV